MIEIDDLTDRQRHGRLAAKAIAAAAGAADLTSRADHLRKAVDHLTAAKRFTISPHRP